MPTHGLKRVLAARLDEMAQTGRLKGRESVICGVVPGCDVYGPRYLIEGEGDTPFLRMNSNSYLQCSHARGRALLPQITLYVTQDTAGARTIKASYPLLGLAFDDRDCAKY